MDNRLKGDVRMYDIDVIVDEILKLVDIVRFA